MVTALALIGPPFEGRFARPYDIDEITIFETYTSLFEIHLF